MTFVKYTDEGKVVIQPAALMLSSLNEEELLEMHTLDKVLILLKDEMTPQETVAIVEELTRFCGSLMADAAEKLEERSDRDTIRIPLEAFEDAGIDAENLRLLIDDGLLIFARDDKEVNLSSRTIAELMKCGIPAAKLAELLKEYQADGE